MSKLSAVNKLFFILTFILFLPSVVSAADFGLVLNTKGGFGNRDNAENQFDFNTNLLPRFSVLIGTHSEFFLSAGFSYKIEKEEYFFIPELFRTELTMRFGSSRNSGIRAGRIGFSDPLSFIAEGLFDGIQFFNYSNAGYFSIGAWYTGLLYKETANITMTAYDEEKQILLLDYNNFTNTYFAPRRAFTSFGWEHPSIGEFLHLNTAIIAQIDFTDSDIKYHNQYIVLKAEIPINKLLFELGGSVEISQSVTDNETDIGVSLAGEFGFYWLFPGEYNSRLSFNAIIAGGKIEGGCEAFVPITSKYYGFIYQHKMSALSVLSLNYSSRLNQAFGISAAAQYFVRNDIGSIPTGSDTGYFLGPEFYAKAVWSPVSDIQLNLAGGIFFPALGDAMPDEKLRWRIELSFTMSLF